MKLLRIYFWLIPSLFFITLFLRNHFRMEGCVGLVEVFKGILFFALIIINQIAILGSQVIRLTDWKVLERSEIIHRFLLVFGSVGLLIWTYSMFSKPTDYFKSKVVLHGETDMEAESISLREDQTYTVKQGFTDFACYYSGSYKINQDTLYLEARLPTETEGHFSDRYLIKEDRILLPIPSSEISDNPSPVIFIKELQ